MLHASDTNIPVQEPPPEQGLTGIFEAWERASGRFGAYELVMPGDPSFTCIAEECEARCCRVFSVALDEHDAARMVSRTGRPLAELIEFVDGEPLTVPMADPYLLLRREGRCAQLDGYACGSYDGRPMACRLYPFQVLMLERATGRPVHCQPAEVLAAIEALAATDEPADNVAVLVRHTECPGFIGPPLTLAGWKGLLGETARLQFRMDPPEAMQ